jgi:hypothetical protein
MREGVLLTCGAVNCAGCRGRREALSGEACGSSRRGELRGRVGISRSLQRSVNWCHNRPAEWGVAGARRRGFSVVFAGGAAWMWIQMVLFGGMAMCANLRFVVGLAWRYGARICACSCR